MYKIFIVCLVVAELALTVVASVTSIELVGGTPEIVNISNMAIWFILTIGLFYLIGLFIDEDIKQSN
jgi:hypothetical protein